MAYYKDLREYLKALEAQGKLTRIKSEVNKDTQIHSLVRLQFRGLPEEERRAFLFENIIDSRGRKYKTPVAVGVSGGSRDIYAIGMMCKREELYEKWTYALTHPIEPKIVASGLVHEEVHVGDNLLEHGGLDEFPIPISTPGFDGTPYLTAPCWVTKDPDTGIRNVGTYRGQVKSPTRTGLFYMGPSQDIATHWRKCKERGIPLQAAIVIGASPNIGYASIAHVPYELDEFAAAGGIAGEPVELVRCKTVDLEVPAYAEIVLEGEISTAEAEPEAPFGEATGYIGQREVMPYFTIKCITHRKAPIWHSFIAQFPPSEDHTMRTISDAAIIYKQLKHDLNIKDVLAVWADQSTAHRFCVIQMKKTDPAEVWRALEGVVPGRPCPKVIIAVDEDINIEDSDVVNWAISLRVQPHRDCRIITFPSQSTMDYSLEPPGGGLKRDPNYPDMPTASRLLIDATRKWPYPPVALPKKEFMEQALQLWEREGLPKLKLREPWWGYNLGYWSEEEEEQASLAIKGEYYTTGETLAQRRRPV